MEGDTGYKDKDLLERVRELERMQPQMTESLEEFRKKFNEYQRTKRERASEERPVCRPFLDVFRQQR